MANPKSHKYVLLRYIFDAPIVFCSYLFALYFSGILTSSENNSNNYLFTVVVLAVWYTAASFSRLYADRRSNKFSEEIIFIIYSLILFAILLSSISFFLRSFFTFTTEFFIYLLCTLLILQTIEKYIIRKLLHAAIFQGALYDNILIIGATSAALDFLDTIHRYYYYGYKCIGFLDDEKNELNESEYLGKIDNLSNILKQGTVDEVMIALDSFNSQQIQSCIEICDYYRIKARIVPNVQQYAGASGQVNNIGLLPVINIRALPLDKQENKILKRIFDIVFSLLFFIILGWWLLPLIAFAIKITSKGPAIFKQERWGLNNKKITCYKFRTMVAKEHDVDNNGHYQQATRNDPRVTKLGAFMRSTNMDELPQFWNVLIGNMSVVGPRPHPTPLNIESMHTIENYMLRHIVTPGITGWAQVNGARGETKETGSMQKRINFDLYYIHRWTFWLDSQIILQTIINIFRRDQNAY